MTATPPSRTTTTPRSPAVSRENALRGAAGLETPRGGRQAVRVPGGASATPRLIRRFPDGGDAINRTARQVRRGRTGLVHAIVGYAFDPARGFHYLTDCDRMLWADRGAMLTTFGIDCHACKAMRKWLASK